MQEVVLFYNGLDVLTRQILDSRGAIPSKTAADAKVAIQEMTEYSQKWHNETSRTRSIKTSDGLAAIQAQLNNLGREIKKVNEKVYAAQVGCKQCKGPHYTKDCPLKEERKTLEEAYYTQFGAPFQGGMSKVLQERGFGSLTSSTETNPRDHVNSISTIVEVDSYPIRRMGSSQYAVSTGQNRTLMYETKQKTIPFLSRLNGYYCEEKKGSSGLQFSKAYSEASHINNSIPRKEKDPGSLTLC
ncbi:reverse transcriptase domain-containing protein [Tanacetum coccineum]